jgi:hypothetical protein
MKTLAVILPLLVLGSVGWAQTKSDEQLSPNVRLYQPKTLTRDRAEQAANFVNSVGISGVRVTWEPLPQAFAIRASSSAPNVEGMDAAEALLKRFDVPDIKKSASQIDLTVYLIRASSGPAPSDRQPPTSPVPAELQPAIDEMKGTFSYDRYALWDAIVIQPKGSGEVQGILPVSTSYEPYVYTVSYQFAAVEGKNLNLDDFQFSIKMPNGDKGIDSHIRTASVTVHDGQKLVLGKIRLLPTANADLFLVLTTKVH